MEKQELSLCEKIDLEIGKILFLANQINRKTEMCCFSNDVAHCEYIEIKMHPTKQDYNSSPITFKVKYSINSEYTWNKDSKERLEELERCVDFLETTLKDKKIDYSVLHHIKEYVVIGYEI